MRLFVVLILSAFSVISQAQSPAYFESSYLEAKEKAQQSKKLCVVVFTQDNSKSAAYTTAVSLADVAVKKQITQNYVGVVSNIKDFDGKIIFKKWQLTKAPSFAIVSPTGTLVATVNHGLSKAKLAEFLQFYSLPGNAGKSVNYDDAAFEPEVAQWQGYKGIVEDEADAPLAVSKPKSDVPKQVEVVSETSQKSAAQPESQPDLASRSTSQEKPASTPPVQYATKKDEIIASARPSDNSVSYKWMVQAGVFGAEASAKALVTKINNNGGKGTIEVINQGDKNVYKVLAGKFQTESDARNVIAKLSDAGIQSFIKPIN